MSFFSTSVRAFVALLPLVAASQVPPAYPSSEPSESSSPSTFPSLGPSESSNPSTFPSLEPSESSNPSTFPSLGPSESSIPSTLPSLEPSESISPSNTPSESCNGETCIGENVCVAGVCIESTAHRMFDSIAKSYTNNPAATYDSTTSTTFDNLFTCSSGDSMDDILRVTHSIWQGFVDYSQTNVTIEINAAGTGLVEVADFWGQRCDNPDPSAVQCDLPDSFYQECEGGICHPKIVTVDLPDLYNVDLEIPILEPCNFVSSLSYCRVINQICGQDFYNMNSEVSTALQHAFVNLGAGSAMWHGSHTYAGYWLDNQLIAVIAFLVHQLIVSALADANGYTPDAPEVAALMNLQQGLPRTKTAIETSMYVSEIITTRPIAEWAPLLEGLDVPIYESTFLMIMASVLTVIFPDGSEIVADLLSELADSLGINTDLDDLNTTYLPVLQSLVSNLNLTDDKKFVLFRQLVGTLCKLVFAFAWQEQILDIPLFKQPLANEIAPDIMAPLASLFNFISGFEYVDADFQTFTGMYPGMLTKAWSV